MYHATLEPNFAALEAASQKSATWQHHRYNSDQVSKDATRPLSGAFEPTIALEVAGRANFIRQKRTYQSPRVMHAKTNYKTFCICMEREPRSELDTQAFKVERFGNTLFPHR